MMTDRFNEISNEIYLLHTGVRNCCIIDSVDEEDIKLIKKLISRDEYRIRDEKYWDPINGKWINNIYIYKYDFQEKLIDIIIKAYEAGVDNHFLMQYALGKLLGYSDDSMEDYFKRLEKYNPPPWHVDLKKGIV